MTKKELYKLSFEDAVNELSCETNTITTYDTLKDFIKLQIDKENNFLAYHLIKAIWEDETPFDSDYYDYDYTMGTLDKPTPLFNLEDLEKYCED